MTGHGAPLLEVSGLTKAFGGNEVIRGFDLTVHPGGVLGLVGANGAGKSTIFNLLTGFLRADAGAVHWKGRSISGLSPRRISRLGIGRTFQEVRLFERMTVLENLLVAAEDSMFGRGGQTARRIARQVAERVGVWSVRDVPAGELSYAEQKFVAVGRAMARRPELLLLDEPASGLDGSSTERLLELVGLQRTLGTTVVLIEHNLDFVRQAVDEMAFLEFGVVRAYGTPEEIMNRADLAEAYFGG
jgi:branched-chain amino acid transport system ATP-binding protein